MARNGGITALGRTMLLHAMFGHGSQGAHAMPAAGWLALLTGPADLSGTGWDLPEPPFSYLDEAGSAVPTGYARVEVPLGQASGYWALSGLSSATNIYELVFPPVASTWGVVRYWAVTDAEEGGRLLLHGEFPVPMMVSAGDTVAVPAGGVLVSLDSYDMEW